MKFRIPGMSLLIALVLAIATAQGQDTIGLFFDEAGSITKATTSTPYQAVTGWLLMLDPSRTEGVNSWECEVRALTRGPEPLIAWEVLGTNIIVSQPPLFQVGMGIPHPWAPVIALASANILVPEPGQKVVFQILPFDPPSLADPPGYPVYKPVYGSGSAVDLFPLDVPGGCISTPVAWINSDWDGPEPDFSGIPSYLSFGVVDSGSFAELHFWVHNSGPVDVIGTISLDNGEFQYSQGDNYWTTQPTDFRIDSGQWGELRVIFLPTTTEPTYGELSLEYCGRIANVILVGGLDVDCWVNPTAIDFGDVGLPDGWVARTATITNRGDIPMDASPRFLEDCPDFSWEPYGGSEARDPGHLQPGMSYTVLITYAPDDEANDTCTLVFGDGGCGQVDLSGRALYLPPSCRSFPNPLNFGALAPDSIQVKSFWVTNTGGGVLEGEVSLTDVTGAFRIVSGGSPFALEFGDTAFVDVRFSPRWVGSFRARVDLGTACLRVLLEGECALPDPEYAIFPSTLIMDWDLQTFGETGNIRDLKVDNLGQNPVSGDVQISGDPGYTILSPAGPFTIEPGTTQVWTCQWVPSVFGEATAVISTGLPGGETITCRGFGVEVLPWLVNKLGFYFDPGFTTNTVQAGAGTQLTGYLVIKVPSAPISGWELKMSVDGTAQFLDWTLNGGATGELGPEVFRVQLAEPMPAGTTAVLATATILVHDSGGSWIQAVNPPDPVIPGFCSYVDGDDPGNHLPLGYRNASIRLAGINCSSVGVEAPNRPSIQEVGGEVALDWSCGNDPAEEYHVYRRLGDQEFARLTAVPVGCTDGFGSFRDRPEAGPGTVVSYAISAMRDGQESPLSVAAEVTLNTGIPSRTRLLASYPNPFNPQTTVPFVMAEPGHARLAVYDLAGRLVAVLLDQDLPAGLQERVWSGLDSRGRPVPSGVYYLRLDAGGRVDMGKTMLLK